MGMFDVDDLTNKVDVGSQPGTMWSLSSQKPGHGIPQLRDPDISKMWQSDGILPHLINIQFARRTVLTHISLYMDFKLDDSYTPNKIRVFAGTYFHDLVEVRTREIQEASGWKHFVLDKFDDKNESEESDSDAEGSDASMSSSLSSSDLDETLSIVDHTASGEALRTKGTRGALGLPNDGSQKQYLACGVSKRHAPIDAFLIQICILSNHAAGKDSHLRGIRVFGPPTRQSRDKARQDARKQREGQKVTGQRALRQRQERESRQRRHAYASLRRWVEEDDGSAVGDASSLTRDDMPGEDTNAMPVSRHLHLLSSIR